jgi:hypothetical protein
MRPVVITLAIIFLAGCGAEKQSASAPAEGTRTAIDETARVQYELSGTHLRVEVLPDAPRFEDLFLGRGAFTFAAGRTPTGRSAIQPPRGPASSRIQPEPRKSS